MAYTVEAVGPEPRQWTSTNGGPMNSWRMRLKDDHGNVVENVEWSRKAASAPPQVGQRLDGTVTESDYGPKFKAQAFAAPGGKGMTPEDRQAIQRMASHKAAMKAAELALQLGIVPNPGSPEEMLKLIARFADWFDRDVQRFRKVGA